MKLKILLGMLGIVASMILSITGLMQTNKLTSELKNTRAEIATMQNDYQGKSAEEQALLEDLERSGNSGFLDNLVMANQLSGLMGAEMKEITALQLVGDEMIEIIKITEPSDVSYFTNTVQYVRYDYTITDSAQFIAALSSLNLVIYSSDIDLVNSTASIIIPSASQISGEYAPVTEVESTGESLPEDSSEMSSEVSSPTLNDSTGLYDNNYLEESDSEATTGDEIDSDYYEIELQ